MAQQSTITSRRSWSLRGRAALVLLVLAGVSVMVSPAEATFSVKTADPATFAASTAFTYLGGQLYDYPSFYLRLADPTGASTLADASGSGSPGLNPVPDNGTAASRYQVAGAPVGDGDTAVHFDGAGSYVVADSGDPSVTQEYSIELWFRVTGPGGGLLAASAYPVPNASTWSRMMYVDSGGRLTYGDYTAATGGIQSVRSPGIVADGLWHHAVGNHIGNAVTLYLDGVSQGSVWSPPQAYGALWAIGGVNVGWGGWSNVPPNNYLIGDIDEFAYYRYGLTNAQVTAHLAATAGTTYSATVLADNPALYWRFDEPALTVTTVDRTGNNFTGSYYLTNQIIGGQPGALTTIPNNSTWFSGRQTNAYVQTYYHGPANFTGYIWFKTTSRHGGVLYSFGNNPTGGSNSYDRHLWMLNDGDCTKNGVTPDQGDAPDDDDDGRRGYCRGGEDEAGAGAAGRGERRPDRPAR